jgi:hypothetical protein
MRLGQLEQCSHVIVRQLPRSRRVDARGYLRFRHACGQRIGHHVDHAPVADAYVTLLEPHETSRSSLLSHPRDRVLLPRVCDSSPPGLAVHASAEPVAHRGLLAFVQRHIAISLAPEMREEPEVDALRFAACRAYGVAWIAGLVWRRDPRMRPDARLAHAARKPVPAQLVLPRERGALPRAVVRGPRALMRAHDAACWHVLAPRHRWSANHLVHSRGRCRHCSSPSATTTSSPSSATPWPPGSIRRRAAS